MALALALFFSLPIHVHSETKQENVIISNTIPAATHNPIATSTTKQPERNIKYFADLYNVDYSLAKRIAWCESRYDPSVDNLYSSASGLYQFLDGTWAMYAKLHWGTTKGHSVYDYGDNAELGVWVISKYGTGDWVASSGCWKT